MGAPRHEKGWTEDRVAQLKKLWLEGQSATQIAGQLGGGVTRNACIAKVHRLGMSNRGGAGGAKPVHQNGSSSIPKKKSVAAPVLNQLKPATINAIAGLPVAVAPTPLSPDPKIAAVPRSIDLLELGPHDCKWPLGKVAPFTFCGLRQTGDSVYCSEHERVAHPTQTQGRPRNERELVRSVRRYL